MFRINEVLEYENERFRILSRFGNNFVWISVDNKSAFPSIIDLYSLDLAIQDESLHRVEDPYSYLLMLSPEDGSTAQVKRDQNYKLISPIIHLEEYYQPKQRAKAIDLVMYNHKTTKQTLYRLIRQYWQRGRLLTRFFLITKIPAQKAKRGYRER